MAGSPHSRLSQAVAPPLPRLAGAAEVPAAPERSACPPCWGGCLGLPLCRAAAPAGRLPRRGRCPEGSAGASAGGASVLRTEVRLNAGHREGPESINMGCTRNRGIARACDDRSMLRKVRLAASQDARVACIPKADTRSCNRHVCSVLLQPPRGPTLRWVSTASWTGEVPYLVVRGRR